MIKLTGGHGESNKQMKLFREGSLIIDQTLFFLRAHLVQSRTLLNKGVLFFNRTIEIFEQDESHALSVRKPLGQLYPRMKIFPICGSPGLESLTYHIMESKRRLCIA